jgi:hypothetical protein
VASGVLVEVAKVMELQGTRFAKSLRTDLQVRSMAYVNELVLDADIAKHDLKALCQRYVRLDLELEWTVDRARNSYLMEMRSNPQDPSMSEFVFYWDGQLGEELLQAETRLSDDRSQYHMRWHRLAASFQARSPEDAQQHQARMAALKEALTAYRSSGLSSPSSVTYVVDFDF